MVFDGAKVAATDEIEKAKISTSGGNFILQLPLDPSAVIDDIQKRLNYALQFTGLNFILVSTPLEKEKKGGYQSALKALNAQARERKYNLLLGDHNFFEPFPRGNFQNVLANSKWEKITDQLKDKEKTHFKIEASQSGKATSHLDINKEMISLAGYHITFGKEGVPLSRFLESVFPVKDTQTILFEQLAKSDWYDWRSKKTVLYGGDAGVEKLGILAMDVDNLGVAIEAVTDDIEHRIFDQELQVFFNDKLREIIKKGTYKNKVGRSLPKYENKIYPVTAGGDDTMFVGKWNTLLDLAGDIRTAFLDQFGERRLSISAALVIVKPNFPVVRFAELAEDALKAAKYTYEGQKGNLHLLGEVLDWEIFNKEVLKTRRDFATHARSLISSGLLAKARQTAAKISDQKGITLSDLWKMGYYFRDIGNNGKALLKRHRNYLEQSLNEQNKLKGQTLRLVFPVAARLAEFDARNK
ncbi:MAG: hypothetical protein DHS20C18_29370 [Saprospiraceae bacterium]|nr:MAG: hypothetical protein DHS20C18_29370 [Saprospiraceae bacterium]